MTTLEHQERMQMHNLPARDAIAIAASYGLPYRTFKRTIRLLMEQARDYHLYPDINPMTARELFDSYMAQTAYEMQADGLAHADFCRNAY